MVHAASDSAAGQYLTVVGGCNDCHTPGWAESNGKTPLAQQLTGNPVGYRGPWGTSYAANLRTVAQRATEDRWVQILTTADGGRPTRDQPHDAVHQFRSRAAGLRPIAFPGGIVLR